MSMKNKFAYMAAGAGAVGLGYLVSQVTPDNFYTSMVAGGAAVGMALHISERTETEIQFGSVALGIAGAFAIGAACEFGMAENDTAPHEAAASEAEAKAAYIAPDIFDQNRGDAYTMHDIDGVQTPVITVG
ncbi:MAG: hypothetical protein CMH27_03955 [Micavibrio sp.]|nr:hypothetical protein [Micavibrio sp.]